jgi:hypothetical protein
VKICEPRFSYSGSSKKGRARKDICSWSASARGAYIGAGGGGVWRGKASGDVPWLIGSGMGDELEILKEERWKNGPCQSTLTNGSVQGSGYVLPISRALRRSNSCHTVRILGKLLLERSRLFTGRCFGVPIFLLRGKVDRVHQRRQR